MARTETTLGVWHDTIMQDADARPLTREQEAALWPVARSGDLAAKLKLLKSQWRLCYKIALRYEWTGCDIDDLIGWGMVGLERAFNKYKPATGNKFSTVSSLWIRQEIGYQAPRMHLTCTAPLGLHYPHYRADHGVSEEEWESIKYRFYRGSNFETELDESGDVASVIDMYAKEHGQEADTYAENGELRQIMKDGLQALTEPRKSIVIRRMAGETLEHISHTYRVTKERIRQMEAEGHTRLKRWLVEHYPHLAGQLAR